MSTCLVFGDAVTFHNEHAVRFEPNLPLGIYTVDASPVGELFLRMARDFDLPDRLYGNTDRDAGRILGTFADRDCNTGVLLVGNKGSGKTLLSKVISNRAMAEGVPTIIVNKAWEPESFMTLMAFIEDPCVVILDEFEKNFPVRSGAQEKILTLLDGVMSSKKLFILTANDTWQISEFLINRPGRLFYSIEFGRLQEDFVREYAEEHLDNKANIDSLCRLGTLVRDFNFDMLKALVEEMNRYDESAMEALSYLNVNPIRYGRDRRFKISFSHPSLKEPIGLNSHVDDELDPMKFSLRVYRSLLEDCARPKISMQKLMKMLPPNGIRFTHGDLVEFDDKTKSYTYKLGDCSLRLTEESETKVNYTQLF